MHKPFVIVVTGRPGSGKTTLAHRLANQIHCPALCRDEFKEGYIHTTGESHESFDEDINRQLYEAFFEVVDFVVSKGISIVVEAAFQHRLWEPKLRPLMDAATVSIIVCLVDPQLARSRCTERRLADPLRERFHGEKVVPDDLDPMIGEYIPPEMDVPTLRVDTSDGYEPGIEQIIDFAMRSHSTNR